jgi:hypothetical protein
MEIIDIVPFLIVVLYLRLGYKLKKQKLIDNAKLIYFTNIKNALQRVGFIGSAGDVHETPAGIESLYYLKDLRLLNLNLKRTNLKATLQDDSTDKAVIDIVGDIEPLSCQITIELNLDDSVSKAQLCLTILENESYPNSTPCSVNAPTYFFDHANLSFFVASFASDIYYVSRDKESKGNRWVFGINTLELQSFGGLSLMSSDIKNKHWKKARTLISKGYKH